MDCDEALLLALAAGAGVSQAARRAGCSERTVRRRLLDSSFRARVSAQRGELVQAAVGRLATLGTVAADELYRLIQNGANDSVKLGAARAVLGYMLAGHSNETLARQVEELRQQLEDIENGTGDNQQAGGGNPDAAGEPPGEAGADPGTDSPEPGFADGEDGPESGPVATSPADEAGEDETEPLFA